MPTNVLQRYATLPETYQTDTIATNTQTGKKAKGTKMRTTTIQRIGSMALAGLLAFSTVGCGGGKKEPPATPEIKTTTGTTESNNDTDDTESTDITAPWKHKYNQEKTTHPLYAYDNDLDLTYSISSPTEATRSEGRQSTTTKNGQQINFGFVRGDNISAIDVFNKNSEEICKHIKTDKGNPTSITTTKELSDKTQTINGWTMTAVEGTINYPKDGSEQPTDNPENAPENNPETPENPTPEPAPTPEETTKKETKTEETKETSSNNSTNETKSVFAKTTTSVPVIKQATQTESKENNNTSTEQPQTESVFAPKSSDSTTSNNSSSEQNKQDTTTETNNNKPTNTETKSETPAPDPNTTQVPFIGYVIQIDNVKEMTTNNDKTLPNDVYIWTTITQGEEKDPTFEYSLVSTLDTFRVSQTTPQTYPLEISEQRNGNYPFTIYDDMQYYMTYKKPTDDIENKEIQLIYDTTDIRNPDNDPMVLFRDAPGLMSTHIQDSRNPGIEPEGEITTVEADGTNVVRIAGYAVDKDPENNIISKKKIVAYSALLPNNKTGWFAIVDNTDDQSVDIATLATIADRMGPTTQIEKTADR